MYSAFGHCPNSDWTPALNRALWDQFGEICKITVVAVNKCPKPSGQAFRPPQNKDMPIWTWDNSSLNKCPKPSGQAFRPPKNKDMPVWTWCTGIQPTQAPWSCPALVKEKGSAAPVLERLAKWKVTLVAYLFTCIYHPEIYLALSKATNINGWMPVQLLPKICFESFP